MFKIGLSIHADNRMSELNGHSYLVVVFFVVFVVVVVLISIAIIFLIDNEFTVILKL